jgi:hypothetical protein
MWGDIRSVDDDPEAQQDRVGSDHTLITATLDL